MPYPPRTLFVGAARSKGSKDPLTRCLNSSNLFLSAKTLTRRRTGGTHSCAVAVVGYLVPVGRSGGAWTRVAQPASLQVKRCPMCGKPVSKVRREKCPADFCQDAVGCSMCFARYYKPDAHKDCARLKEQTKTYDFS